MPKAPLDEQMPTTSEVNGLNQPTMLIRAYGSGSTRVNHLKTRSTQRNKTTNIYSGGQAGVKHKSKVYGLLICALTKEHASQSIIMYLHPCTA